PHRQITRVDLDGAPAGRNPLRREIERHVARTLGLDERRQLVAPFFKAMRLPDRHDVLPPQSHIIVSAIGPHSASRAYSQHIASAFLDVPQIAPGVVRYYRSFAGIGADPCGLQRVLAECLPKFALCIIDADRSMWEETPC